MPYKPENNWTAYKRSSRALGEPPLLMAAAVHSAIRDAIMAARCAFCPLSAVWCLLSAVCCLLSAVCCLLSAVCCLLSAVCCLLSTVCCLLSAGTFCLWPWLCTPLFAAPAWLRSRVHVKSSASSNVSNVT
jgi:hypothetical protein